MEKKKKYTLLFIIGIAIVLLTPYIPDSFIQIIWGDTEEIYASRFCGVRIPELFHFNKTRKCMIVKTMHFLYCRNISLIFLNICSVASFQESLFTFSEKSLFSSVFPN